MSKDTHLDGLDWGLIQDEEDDGFNPWIVVEARVEGVDLGVALGLVVGDEALVMKP